MNAVVLAGGFGTRLKPLTDDCPKPLLPVAGHPMLDYTVAQLHAYGIDRVTFTLGYKSDSILRFVSGYKSLEAAYYIENKPMGTCGGVKAACGACGDTFLVLSGDALSDIDLAGLAARHHTSGAQVTMAVVRASDPRRYGVAEVGADGFIDGFVEKPKKYRGEAWVNAGVYCINKSILEYVPENSFFDFSRDLFPVLVASREVAAFKHEGYWTDIGDIESYYRANFDMLYGGFYRFLPNAHVKFLSGPNADDTLIDSRAQILGMCKRSILGVSRIEPEGAAEDCVVLDGARVERSLRGCIVGREFIIPVRQPQLLQKENNFFEKQL